MELRREAENCSGMSHPPPPSLTPTNPKLNIRAAPAALGMAGMEVERWCMPVPSIANDLRTLGGCAHFTFTPRLPTREARFWGNKGPLQNPSSSPPHLSSAHALQDVSPGAGREPELREGITDPAPSMAAGGALGCRVRGSDQPISAQSPGHFPVPYSLDQPLTSWGPTLVTTLHSRRKLLLPFLLLWLPRFGVEPLGFQD